MNDNHSDNKTTMVMMLSDDDNDDDDNDDKNPKFRTKWQQQQELQTENYEILDAKFHSTQTDVG